MKTMRFRILVVIAIISACGRVGAVEAGDKLIDPADETISSMAGRTGAAITATIINVRRTGKFSFIWALQAWVERLMVLNTRGYQLIQTSEVRLSDPPNARSWQCASNALKMCRTMRGRF